MNLKTFVDALFAFLEGQFPWLQGVLERIKSVVSPQVATAHLTLPITEVGLQALVDEAMVALEGALKGHPLEVALLRSLNVALDAVLLPQLWTYLQSIGLVP